MPTFRYTATDADGQPVLGTLDASGIDEARSELIGKGLRIESLADQTFEKISSQQAKDVGQYIADLTQSSLPVSEGLRQLSYELAAQSMWPSKTARILTSIADRLDAGESLTDELVDETARRLFVSRNGPQEDAHLSAIGKQLLRESPGKAARLVEADG